MKNVLLVLMISCLSLPSCLASKTISSSNTAEKTMVNPDTAQQPTDGFYNLVVEGFDWGAAVSKVILIAEDSLTEVNGNDFEVVVKKATACADLSPKEATGQLKVLYAYISDAKGNKLAKGTHITLAIYASPLEQIGSPIKYFFNNPNCAGNQWIDFNLTITTKTSAQIWNQEKERIIPLVDEFDLSGSFTHDSITMTFADFTPKSKLKKRPLLIWLHGAGEGGTDPSIALIANRAANYAAPEIQAYFEGAYVLIPQSPTFWMDKGNRQYTRGEVEDKYNKSLMALIEDYVNRHPNIDKNRIYVGGCSNGGYMTLKLLLLRPDYFAAGFPSALAYHGKYLTDEATQRIKDLPIWFIHSKDDPVTIAEETVIPTYQKLLAAGAKKVHLSLFDQVIDITNQFGGEAFTYNGHFSWIYSHTNKCQLDYDGTPVKIEGYPVTLMGWLARQRKGN